MGEGSKCRHGFLRANMTREASISISEIAAGAYSGISNAYGDPRELRYPPLKEEMKAQISLALGFSTSLHQRVDDSGHEERKSFTSMISANHFGYQVSLSEDK